MRVSVIMPDFELPEVPCTAGCWLTRLGRPVQQGDRVLEVVAGAVTVDLSAPVSGRLVGGQVREGDSLTPGQVLGYVETQDHEGDQ